MDLILLAVPFFAGLILLELVVEKVRGTDYYSVSDSITSLTTGVLSELVKAVELLIPFTIYVVVHQQYAWYSLPDTPLVWVVAFIAYDFCYYWLHRFGHEMNLLWAAHVVHHSSEEYNLTTALRQTSTGFLGFIFFLPLALLGFDPLMILTVGALNLIYQFWVHTRHIGNLGWYENFFITPSNHRVHHAQNGIYIDRNYGGVFILWDKMFGSYQEELQQQPPIYGLRGALNSWNPIWANVQVYNQLWQDCLHTKNWWHKLTIWFRRTGWRPPDVVDRYPLHKTDLQNFHKFAIPLSLPTKLYAVLQYLLNVTVGLLLLLNSSQLAMGYQLSIVAFVIYSSFAVATVIEQRPVAKYFEVCKHLSLVLVSFALIDSLSLALTLITFSVLSGILAFIAYRQSASLKGSVI